MAAIFPKYPNCPNTSLAACCSFSNSLPRERGRVAVGIKGSARKISCADCFLFFRRPASTAANPSYFSNCLKPQNPLQSAPSPVGEGWGEGTLQIAAIFPNHLTAPIQAFRLVTLSLTLSHGERERVAVEIQGFCKENRLCRLLFAFQTTCINVCKSKLLFKLPETAKPAVTCSLPCGGGLGRGHSPNGGNLSQHPNRPNTSLAACCPLSNSLPRERGRGGCWN